MPWIGQWCVIVVFLDYSRVPFWRLAFSTFFFQNVFFRPDALIYDQVQVVEDIPGSEAIKRFCMLFSTEHEIPIALKN